MLKTLKEFFTSTLEADSNHDTGHDLNLAAAVLMVEISMADSSIGEEERRIIHNAMQESFNLSEDEAHTIISLAEKEVDHAVSLHEFTSLINQTLSAEEKSGIVGILWEVAFADKILDKYEEYFIRKIADLLYVSHQDYIKAKHRAMKKH
jgi:uncharacterized tellurite resistance protein B-like protein